MTDDLGKIALARVLARRSYRTIQENLFVGVGVVHVLVITGRLARLDRPHSGGYPSPRPGYSRVPELSEIAARAY